MGVDKLSTQIWELFSQKLALLSLLKYFSTHLFINKYFNSMNSTYQSTTIFPETVRQVAFDTVDTLTDFNYFEDRFNDPQEAKKSFFEGFGHSLISKFLKGDDLIWCELEFKRLMEDIGFHYYIEEMASMNLINVFDCEDGDKIIVKNQHAVVLA